MSSARTLLGVVSLRLERGVIGLSVMPVFHRKRRRTDPETETERTHGTVVLEATRPADGYIGRVVLSPIATSFSTISSCG